VDASLAELYDLFPFDRDIGLYLDVAAREGGRILELACGTGRVLVPLAEAGNHVTGVDASPHMLARASAKLAAGPEAAKRARLVQGDFLSFDLGESFDAAIVAVRSFSYVTEPEDQLATLLRIARHLRPGGVLALDLLNPSNEWVGQPSGSMRQDLFAELPDGGFVSRTETAVSTDRARQVRVIRSAYEIAAGDGTVVKRVVEWPFRYTYRFEAEHLLARGGFDVEAVSGGYEGEPFTGESDTMLLLARRR
jgi:SAM-dependent methyltransferase